MTCIFTENVTLPQVFFKYFASKNQVPGLSISGTLVENGLIRTTKLNRIDLQETTRLFCFSKSNTPS